MSAIFGIVYLDGQPAPGTAAQIMRARLAHWGPDGGGIWHQDAAALGQVLRCVTPEARYETMPLYDATQLSVLVATARLDNREELCDTLAVPLAERPTTPDGWLIWRAYQRWGEACPRHLYGDWSLAVWRCRERRLFVARDHLGSTGLFYSYRPPLFAFASGYEALLALPDVSRRLDEWQLARYLAIFPGDYDHTMWADVRSLLPAQSLSVTPQAMRVQTYWHLEYAPEVRLGSDTEYVEGFLARYRQAIRSRLRSTRPVGSTLSSGLDSGSVTALAAEALRQRGERLVAFTSVPLYPAAHLVPRAVADEWPLAHAVATRWENIEHVPIGTTPLSPLAALERSLAIYPQLVHGAANLFWLLAIYGEAQVRGLGVLLHGQLGNGSISWSGGSNRIWYLFAHGDWSAGMRALAAWRAHHGHSWLETIRSQLLRPVLGPLWMQRHRLARPGAPPWTGYAALQPAFARRLGLRAAVRGSELWALCALPLTPQRERAILFAVNTPHTCPVRHAYGAAFGLEDRDPTGDVRLLEYCLGLPDAQYTYDGGERMLVRRAMAELLPPEVQWNTRRGRQAADVALRLQTDPHAMETTLYRLETTPAVTEYIDTRALRTVWQAVQTRVTPQTTEQAATLLLRGVMAGLLIAGLKAQ